MNTNRPRILVKLATASWLKVCEHWSWAFEDNPNDKERLGFVRFEDNGEMYDGATRCWLRTMQTPMYVQWERLFNKVRLVLYEANIIDKEGYLLVSLSKEIVEKIKESFSFKRKRLMEDRVYEEDATEVIEEVGYFYDDYLEMGEGTFPDENSIHLMEDYEERVDARK